MTEAKLDGAITPLVFPEPSVARVQNGYVRANRGTRQVCTTEFA